MEQFKEAHYVHIPSQGNIYTLTCLKLSNGSTKILAASLKREIFCFEYIESPSGALVPTTKEVSFTYIPSGAEIISLDAFNKSSTNNEFVIGITIIKNSNDSDTLETFLNIYCQLEDNEDFDIENIAQNCLNVELNFIPYKLLHTFLITWKDEEIYSKEIVFILSGSDNHVHIYQENIIDHVYKEMENKEYFPEFPKTPSPVVWIDIYHTEDFSERVTAFGCECGYIKVLKVNTKTNKIMYNFSTRIGNYISCIHLFTQENSEKNRFLKIFNDKNHDPIEKNDSRQVLNLLVVSTILPTVVFHDVFEYGLSDYETLPSHDNSIVLTCCEVADIDFDGEKEIILGNSAEELMLLKNVKEKGWMLEELKKFAAPILGIKYIDVTGDGLKELVVFSMKGIHILQHDPVLLQKALTRKIDALTLPQISNISL